MLGKPLCPLSHPTPGHPTLTKSGKLRLSEVWTHYFESDTYSGCRAGSQSKASDPVCLAYTASHKREQKQRKQAGGQGEQPQDSSSSRLAPRPTPPLPQSLKSHKEGSVLAAHGQAGCPPSPRAWQQHWVTQPLTGDNDHTVRSHTSITALI